MNIFYCRKPYLIEVNADPLQIATKIELFIWKVGTTEPTEPTNVIERELYAPSQYIGKYNISPFVSALIQIDGEQQAYNVTCNKYYKLVDTWIYDSSELNVSVYGYSVPETVGGYKVLQSYFDERYSYSDNPIVYPRNVQYINLLFDFDLYPELSVEYRSDIDNEIVNYSSEGLLYLSIPMSTINEAFINGNKVILRYFDGEDYIQFYEASIINVCEPKFNPYILSYTNSFGGTSKLYFFKKSTLSDEFSDSTYNMQGQKQSFNLNGIQSFKLNTGWIRESDVNAVKEMILSEYKKLEDINGIISTNVVIKNKNIIEKTALNDRNINYEFEFESASPIIQDYV